MIELKDLDLAKDREVLDLYIAAAVAGMLANPAYANEQSHDLRIGMKPAGMILEEFGTGVVNYARSAMAARNRFLDGGRKGE